MRITLGNSTAVSLALSTSDNDIQAAATKVVHTSAVLGTVSQKTSIYPHQLILLMERGKGIAHFQVAEGCMYSDRLP